MVKIKLLGILPTFSSNSTFSVFIKCFTKVKLPLLKNIPCIIPSPVNSSNKESILLSISMFGPINP